MKSPKIGFVGATSLAFFALSATAVLAATTAFLYPNADGTYQGWTSGGLSHYTRVNETNCDGLTTHVSSTSPGSLDSYTVSLSSVPYGSHITQIEIVPCASRSTGSGSSATMAVFFRWNGTDSSNGPTYSFSSSDSNVPSSLTATTFSGLNLYRNSLTDVLEIGAKHLKGSLGVNLSNMKVRLTYN
jgi:hypothetical protein